MNAIDFRYDLLPLKDKLYRLALRITLDTAEAEDTVQDTLLRVWEKRYELAAVKSLEAYCLTVCRNLALDRRARAEAANLSLDEAQLDAPDATPRADERMEHEERLRRVDRLFNRLPLQQRTAMQLRDIEGRSYREVAAIMGISEDNVKVTLHRARQALKAQFEKTERNGL